MPSRKRRPSMVRRSVQLPNTLVDDLNQLAELLNASDAQIMREVLKLGVTVMIDKLPAYLPLKPSTYYTTIADVQPVIDWAVRNAN